MFRLNLSSNSQSQDENFDGHFKKVTYQGHLSDSQHQESHSDSNSESSRRAGKLQGKITNNKSSDRIEKGKTIKKNCESAKMSRQRKKVYLELLEQKAEELKTQISNRKRNIRTMAEEIMDKFSNSNQQKYEFLKQKIAVSKRLIAMAADIQQLKKNYQDNGMEDEGPELQKNITPQSQNAIINDNLEESKAKAKKKKEQQRNMTKKDLQQRIREKESCLDLAIKAYLVAMHQRSFRTDVVERSKSEWFQSIQRSVCHNADSSLGASMLVMRGLLQRLQQRSKKLDYFLRLLKNRVRQRFVVQFLLDRQFFIHNSADTIYKNSQLKTH